ncbi:MAG: hypothetical protein WCA19_02200 [Candidatus Acidiferrales bacterium]
MKRSEEKGGRASVRKAQRAARTKPDPTASAPPSVAIIEALTLERQKMLGGLRDALYFYDRVAGNARADHGWTAADVKRLAEIRAVVSNAR